MSSERKGPDDVDRAEYERELAQQERTREVQPSRLVARAGVSMSPIDFDGAHRSRFVWIGQEIDVFVALSVNGRPMGAPPPVAWSSSDTAVLAVRDTSAQHRRCAVIVGVAEGQATLVAETSDGLRRVLELTVTREPEVQWF